MKDIFKIITEGEKEGGAKRGICIGIDVKIGGRDIPCPVTEACSSFEELALEVQEIQRDLESLLGKTRVLFEGPSPADGLEFSDDMSAEEIWNILSKIKEEEQFVRSFNRLDGPKRKEVAEHILTRCNIFAGKAAVFSARYNEASGLME